MGIFSWSGVSTKVNCSERRSFMPLILICLDSVCSKNIFYFIFFAISFECILLIFHFSLQFLNWEWLGLIFVL